MQIAISGWYDSSSLTNGRVLSFSNASLQAVVLPGLVEVVVEPAEDLRHPVDHLDVRLGVQVPEQRVGVVEGVDVADLLAAPVSAKARSIACAARKWPAPADADRIKTRPSIFGTSSCAPSSRDRAIESEQEPLGAEDDLDVLVGSGRPPGPGRRRAPSRTAAPRPPRGPWGRRRRAVARASGRGPAGEGRRRGRPAAPCGRVFLGGGKTSRSTASSIASRDRWARTISSPGSKSARPYWSSRVCTTSSRRPCPASRRV